MVHNGFAFCGSNNSHQSSLHIKSPLTKGEVKQKKKLGGAHPGNRRVAQPVYQPNDNEYTQINSTTAVANAHFVTCPGGNALKLVGKPNRAEEQSAIGGNAKYISGEKDEESK